jgi:hypothetical protein
MKRPEKRPKRVVPQPGGEGFHEGEAAPLNYAMPMPPVKSRGRLIPVQDSAPINCGEPTHHTPVGPAKSVPVPSETGQPASPNHPLIPASEEVAKLPRGAREAFAARCAARVACLRTGATSPEAAAALILAAATVDTPIRRQLLCIRRDYDRLFTLAKEQNWTDDTPVSPDVFGPMWPKNVTPTWVQEPSATESSDK